MRSRSESRSGKLAMTKARSSEAKLARLRELRPRERPVPQPGDALSCIKYVESQQGTTVIIRARVQTSTGTFIEDINTVILPDTRPTRTPGVSAARRL